jgi:hypothetical protein
MRRKECKLHRAQRRMDELQWSLLPAAMQRLVKRSDWLSINLRRRLPR